MPTSPGARATACALIAVAIQFVMVTAYAWPAARLAPRHLPVVIAGPAAQAAGVAADLVGVPQGDAHAGRALPGGRGRHPWHGRISQARRRLRQKDNGP